MPPRRNTLARNGGLEPSERAWLEGDPSCGWIRFRDEEKLEALWHAHGDEAKFYWRRGHRMMLPIPLAELREREDAWLTGESDEYGLLSGLIERQYSAEEKAVLWDARGDKKRFRWRVGMTCPEAVRAASRNEPALGSPAP